MSTQISPIKMEWSLQIQDLKKPQEVRESEEEFECPILEQYSDHYMVKDFLYVGEKGITDEERHRRLMELIKLRNLWQDAIVTYD